MQARSAVTIEPVERVSELGNPIARLMAALTRAGQGNSPSSAPNSPRHRGHGRGRMDRTASSHPHSHNGQTVPGQTTSACSLSASHRTGTTGQSQGNVQGPKDGQDSVSNKDPTSLQHFRCRGWGHMAWEGATPAKSSNQTREDWGNVAQPPTSSSQQ